MLLKGWRKCLTGRDVNGSGCVAPDSGQEHGLAASWSAALAPAAVWLVAHRGPQPAQPAPPHSLALSQHLCSSSRCPSFLEVMHICLAHLLSFSAWEM